MALLDEILKAFISEFGVAVLAFAWILYQVYSPKWLPDTKFQKALGNIEEQIQDTHSLLVSSVTVLRAVVRTNEDVDTGRVDEYLVENGVEPDDFIENGDDTKQTTIGGDDD